METVNTTVSALKMAVKNRTPQDRLIFHCDRESSIVLRLSEMFYEKLQRISFQSMSRKGNCWDNACAESFLKTLKWELDTLEGKHSQAQLRQSVFMYIDAYYSPLS